MFPKDIVEKCESWLGMNLSENQMKDFQKGWNAIFEFIKASPVEDTEKQFGLYKDWIKEYLTKR